MQSRLIPQSKQQIAVKLKLHTISKIFIKDSLACMVLHSTMHHHLKFTRFLEATSLSQ
jgi:hypothetical protein